MSSLVVIGRLNRSHLLPQEEGFFLDPSLGGIDDLGFCDSLDQSLSHRPPRPETVPYDLWCVDRFLSIRADGRSRSIGRVEIAEARVRDNRMRSEIDFTGFKVIISLQTHAYQAYQTYIGKLRMPDLGDSVTWDGRVLFRTPARPFAFPTPRGNSNPWDCFKKPSVGRLKSIKRFAFDEIEIQALRDEQGRRVQSDGDRSGWEPALSLRSQRSSIGRSLMQMFGFGQN